MLRNYLPQSGQQAPQGVTALQEECTNLGHFTLLQDVKSGPVYNTNAA